MMVMNKENKFLKLTDEEIKIILALRTPNIGDQLRSIKEEIDK